MTAFETAIRELFASLEATAKSIRRLHVLPALPLSAAVTLGRVRDPLVHPTLLIYDRADAGYQPALENLVTIGVAATVTGAAAW